MPCRLRTHIQGHENERPYPCTVPGCRWTFPSQSKLGRHMNHHFQIRRFACTFQECSKAFLRQEHLTDHLKTHLNVKVFRCPVEMCTAVFEARKLVQPHVQEAHCKKAEKPVKSPNVCFCFDFRPFRIIFFFFLENVNAWVCSNVNHLFGRSPAKRKRNSGGKTSGYWNSFRSGQLQFRV